MNLSSSKHKRVCLATRCLIGRKTTEIGRDVQQKLEKKLQREKWGVWLYVQQGSGNNSLYMVVFVFCSFFSRKSGLQAHAVEEHTKSFVENGPGILSMVIKKETRS